MEQVVKDFIKELGYENSIDENQEKRVSKWLDWYKSKPKEYIYYVYNGKKKNKRLLKSLSIIPQSCEDISDFYFNEKLDISIDNEEIQKKINEVLDKNKFLYNSNKLMQLVKALGTGMYIPYLQNGVLKINYIDATGLVILDADNSDAKSVLAYSNKNNKIEITAHILTEDGYVIYNREYKNVNGRWIKIDLGEKVETIETKLFVPQFAIIYNTPVNNEDISSDYGLSMYANALDNVLAMDTAYDSLDNEISSGKKRIYVKGGAVKFNIDENGNTTAIFDDSDTTFYQIPGDEKDPMVKEESGELRIDSITDALQSQLNLYTSKIGLGHNYYKFKDGQTYVNTDNVISTNSDIYRKIKKQENILTYALKDLIYAIAMLLGIKEQFSISINYDDSIIEDTEQIRKQAQAEYNSGLISRQAYFRDVYKMNDETAKKYEQQIIKEQNESIENSIEEEPIIE